MPLRHDRKGCPRTARSSNHDPKKYYGDAELVSSKVREWEGAIQVHAAYVAIASDLDPYWVLVTCLPNLCATLEPNGDGFGRTISVRGEPLGAQAVEEKRKTGGQTTQRDPKRTRREETRLCWFADARTTTDAELPAAQWRERRRSGCEHWHVGASEEGSGAE